MSKILVTGGCGYIGSHTIIDLVNNGFHPICIDSNIRSSEHVIDIIQSITKQSVPHYQVDISDKEALFDVLEQHPDLTGVIHFAAYKSVPESVTSPLKYYQNNISSLLNLLEGIQRYKIPNFIFSSSCAVYGNSTELPVVESTPMRKAQSPYATTKQMSEQIIEDFAIANPTINSILLRYFNPAGAHPSGQLGEYPQEGAYNVIPIMIECLLGIRGQFGVAGNDYDTRDGTCIRDYIHVMDVANAHTKALSYLQTNRQEKNCDVFNIGIGQGLTILELIHAFDKATGQKLDYTISPRRAGDVAAVYSDYNKAAQKLGWTPQYDVDAIMSSVWKWTKNSEWYHTKSSSS